MLRHERTGVAMALAEALHHCAQKSKWSSTPPHRERRRPVRGRRWRTRRTTCYGTTRLHLWECGPGLLQDHLPCEGELGSWMLPGRVHHCWGPCTGTGPTLFCWSTCVRHRCRALLPSVGWRRRRELASRCLASSELGAPDVHPETTLRQSPRQNHHHHHHRTTSPPPPPHHQAFLSNRLVLWIVL